MREILETKLKDLEWLSKNGSAWEYYLGQYNLCIELLEVIHQQDIEFQKMAEKLIDNKYPESDETHV